VLQPSLPAKYRSQIQPFCFVLVFNLDEEQKKRFLYKPFAVLGDHVFDCFAQVFGSSEVQAEQPALERRGNHGTSAKRRKTHTARKPATIRKPTSVQESKKKKKLLFFFLSPQDSRNW
jgi:hypothetical protein